MISGRTVVKPKFGDGLTAKDAKDAKTYSWEKSDAHPIGELVQLRNAFPFRGFRGPQSRF